MRRLLTFLAILVALGLALAGRGYWNARADPVVRRAGVALPRWPAGAAPVTVALLSDIHLGSPAMDDARLRRIVGRVAALKPDLVVIAGDFVFGHDPAAGARSARGLTAPLAALKPPLGIFAVLGNHDEWTAPDAVRAALTRAGVKMLDNRAVAVGPLALGGVGDAFTDHDVAAPVLAALAGMPGAPVLLTHSPDLIAKLPAGAAPLVLVGHTHCGQVVLPLVGPLAGRSPKTARRLFDPHYRCGLVRDPGRAVVVTGGLGTSVAPIRFGAPPDVWLLTLGGSVRSAAARPAPAPPR